MKDDELLRRYLLGGLSGDDKDRLESRLIRERKLFELAEAVEDEVLDDYAHGRLDSAERIRVARRLLSSLAGRSRLAVIQGLGKIAAEAAEEETGRGRILPFPVRDLSRPEIRAAAIAAMLLIGAAGVWLAQQKVQPPVPAAPVVAQRQDRAVPEARATPAPSAKPVTPAPQPPDRLAESEAPPVVTPTSAPLVLQLALGTVMRGETTLDQLVVPAGTERIELRLLLAAGDAGYASYEAALIDTTEGSEVLRAPGLAVREIGDDGVLILHLKGSHLHEGTYAIQVQGVTADGEVVDLADHEFGVQTPVK
ncbi:MAG TPA: hypothetical protein VE078_10515 [Thermoanaerobaculia bacterium]|nr:hypothetical protein [Thermoanaerobaculia bacterium]